MEGSVVAMLGCLCILLLAGGMYFFFSSGDDKTDVITTPTTGSTSCTEYECPALYTKRENAQYLDTDDQDSPVNSCCIPRTCQLVDCSASARRSNPDKLTAVIDFTDKDNENARMDYCCISTKESEELESQKFWVIFWIVIASVIGLLGISAILTFRGGSGLYELPLMILRIPGEAVYSLLKFIFGYSPPIGKRESGRGQNALRDQNLDASAVASGADPSVPSAGSEVDASAAVSVPLGGQVTVQSSRLKRGRDWVSGLLSRRGTVQTEASIAARAAAVRSQAAVSAQASGSYAPRNNGVPSRASSIRQKKTQFPSDAQLD